MTTRRPLKTIVKQVRERYIWNVLRDNHLDYKKAASIAGISIPTIYRIIGPKSK